MTKEQWDKYPEYRKELADLLGHPTFRIALEIIKDVGNTPVIPAAMPPGVTLTEWYAAMGAKRDGYFEALTNLRILTQTTPTQPVGAKPWQTLEKPAKAPTP